MTKRIKKTSSHDKAELVGVQGSTEAASSHQPRKKCRTAKIVEASSDQPQKGGRRTEVVRPSSDQTKKRSPKNKLSPEEKRERKRACDNKRYHKKEDKLREIGEMKPQLKVLEDGVEEMLKQIGNLKGDLEDAVQENKEIKPQMEILKNETAELRVELGKIKSERLPAITVDLTTVTEQLEHKENDREIPLDYDYLDGMENWSPEGIPNVENLLTDLQYPPETFDLVGMSRQEILSEFEKMRSSFEESEKEKDRRYEELRSEIIELKRGNERRYEELKRKYEELKSENKELKSENKRLNSRIETTKNK